VPSKKREIVRKIDRSQFCTDKARQSRMTGFVDRRAALFLNTSFGCCR